MGYNTLKIDLKIFGDIFRPFFSPAKTSYVHLEKISLNYFLRSDAFVKYTISTLQYILNSDNRKKTFFSRRFIWRKNDSSLIVISLQQPTPAQCGT
jgi:hypothetical protein